MATSEKTRDRGFWKSIDLAKETIPVSLQNIIKEVVISHKTVKVMEVEVFYREALPPVGVTATGQSLVLLHGRSFSSETWERLGSLSQMAALGHRVIALDIPGYGNTPGKLTGDRGRFLLSLMEVLGLIESRPILVSPSMSGEYSIPFIRDYWKKLSGYVPVAPVATNSVSASVLEKIMIPTLIVYGENDNTGLADASLKNLSVMPNSREVRVKAAGHPAYLNQPVVFHELLFNFLLILHPSYGVE